MHPVLAVGWKGWEEDENLLQLQLAEVEDAIAPCGLPMKSKEWQKVKLGVAGKGTFGCGKECHHSDELEERCYGAELGRMDL